MSSPSIHVGIIIGSTRERRYAEKPAHWIHEIAEQRAEMPVVELMGMLQDGKSFDDYLYPAQAAAEMFDGILWCTRVLKSPRQES